MLTKIIINIKHINKIMIKLKNLQLTNNNKHNVNQYNYLKQ